MHAQISPRGDCEPSKWVGTLKDGDALLEHVAGWVHEPRICRVARRLEDVWRGTVDWHTARGGGIGTVPAGQNVREGVNYGRVREGGEIKSLHWRVREKREGVAKKKARGDGDCECGRGDKASQRRRRWAEIKQRGVGGQGCGGGDGEEEGGGWCRGGGVRAGRRCESGERKS
eukprot:scaffold57512_cov30-Tisochrysis_lutea.AAC.1